MKLLLYLSALFSLYLFSYKETGVSAQGMLPYYGGGITYTEDKDDDIGILLTILLLAARNRGNCCNCCNCPSNNIPIPYPIPIPTNNPIINFRKNDDDKGGSDKGDQEEEINIITNNEDSVSSAAGATDNTQNNSSNNAASSSGAAATG